MLSYKILVTPLTPSVFYPCSRTCPLAPTTRHPTVHDSVTCFLEIHCNICVGSFSHFLYVMELCVITVLATEAQTRFPLSTQRQLNKTQMVCFIQPGAGTRGKKWLTVPTLASRK